MHTRAFVISLTSCDVEVLLEFLQHFNDLEVHVVPVSGIQQRSAQVGIVTVAAFAIVLSHVLLPELVQVVFPRCSTRGRAWPIRSLEHLQHLDSRRSAPVYLKIDRHYLSQVLLAHGLDNRPFCAFHVDFHQQTQVPYFPRIQRATTLQYPSTDPCSFTRSCLMLRPAAP